MDLLQLHYVCVDFIAYRMNTYCLAHECLVVRSSAAFLEQTVAERVNITRHCVISWLMV